jgi:2-oxoglutarate dehydrogenase E1 component
MIPLLDLWSSTAATRGVEEIVIGMAHRGRLNVLANVMEQEPARDLRRLRGRRRRARTSAAAT